MSNSNASIAMEANNKKEKWNKELTSWKKGQKL